MNSTILSLAALAAGTFFLVLPMLYYFLLLFSGGFLMRRHRRFASFAFKPKQRFFIAIAAHNEETVIGQTVSRLKQLSYPEQLFDVCVVADHCSDATAEQARKSGALVFERNSGPRGSKAAALAWLYSEALDETYDGVVIFDADTRVDQEFLRWMNDRLMLGDQIIQGQHCISNARQGWFAALTESLFRIDNLFQNAGREALGLSAKVMGDSICFARPVFGQLTAGKGLTEDFHLRQQLLLQGYRVAYEARAKGFGEAPPDGRSAWAQRIRWMKGTQEVQRDFKGLLLSQAWRQRQPAVIDAAFESLLPSYTSYAAGIVLMSLLASGWWWLYGSVPYYVALPLLVAGALSVSFPLVGLVLDRAPGRCFRALLRGPYYIAWRSFMALRVRLGWANIRWVRTHHSGVAE